MARALAFLLAALGGAGTTGCALVPIPLPRSAPGPVERIRVVDAATGKDVEGAQVTFSLCPFLNWCDGFPAHLSVITPEELASARRPGAGQAPKRGDPAGPTPTDSLWPWGFSPLWSERPDREARKLLKLTKQPDGAYEVEQRTVLRAVWPWGPGPLGWALYGDYTSCVSVSAPGYPTATLTYDPGAAPSPGWSASERAGQCELTADGVLCFRLQAVPASPPVKAPPPSPAR